MESEKRLKICKKELHCMAATPWQASSRSNREQTDGDTATIATTPLLQHHSSLNISGQGITSTFAGNDATHTITQQEHTNQQSVHTTMQATRSGMNYFTAGNGSSPSQAYRHKTSPTQRFMSRFQLYWKDLDATPMPPLRRSELESSLSIPRSSRRRISTKQPCPAQSQSWWLRRQLCLWRRSLRIDYSYSIQTSYPITKSWFNSSIPVTTQILRIGESSI